MPKTLLLADDSVVIQKLVGLSFANEDVELVTTDNGDAAVTRAREVKPDAVLADVVMPGMSGYEVCETIKSDPELQHVPVLLLTGTFEAFDEERARQVGSDGHITKPFEAQALVDRVNELLARGCSEGLATTTPTAGSQDFDFFADEASDLAETTGTDVTAKSPASEGQVPGASGSHGLEVVDAGFAFGGEPTAQSEFEAPELLEDPLDLDAAVVESGEDYTVALEPEEVSRPAHEIPFQQAATVTGLAFEDEEPLAEAVVESGEPEIVDFDLIPNGDESPSNTPTSPWSTIGSETSPPAAAEIDPEMTVLADDFSSSAPAPNQSEPSLTTIIMSDGDNSSDGIALGDDGLVDSPPTVATSLTPADEMILADDLFGDHAAVGTAAAAGDSPPSDATAAAEQDDVFDFDAADPLLGSPGDSFGEASASVPPPAAAGYDISSSDLGDPFAPSSEAQATPEASLTSEPFASTPADQISLSDGLIDGSVPEAEVFSEELPPGVEESATSSMNGPDITPVMRQRIHETLERVAWEAFADLSETMVKQVLERVEAIAWEVVPQMAEALVKDEIRRMKGEDED